VQEKEGIPPAEQRLTYNGTELDRPLKTLSEYKVPKKATLQLGGDSAGESVVTDGTSRAKDRSIFVPHWLSGGGGGGGDDDLGSDGGGDGASGAGPPRRLSILPVGFDVNPFEGFKSVFGGADTSDEGLEDAFKKVDPDGSGRISASQMHSYIKNQYGKNLDPQVIIVMMGEAGVRGGTVTIEEFKVIMRGGKKAKAQVKKAKGGPEVWVECDKCGKWRRAYLTAKELSSEWFCEDNPDTRYNSCDKPQELSNEKMNALLGLNYVQQPEGVVDRKLDRELEPVPKSMITDESVITDELHGHDLSYSASKAGSDTPWWSRLGKGSSAAGSTSTTTVGRSSKELIAIMLSCGYDGLGFEVDATNSVVNVIEGAAADHGDMRVGDVISSVDGVALNGRRLQAS
jgi:hypothetical protein